MSKLLRAIKAFRSEIRGAGSDAFWRRLLEDSGALGTASGLSVGPDGALKYAAFYAAVDRISADIGKLPLKLMRRGADGKREVARTHPVYTLLHDSPNPEQTSFIFRSAQMSYALRWGNCYAEIVRDGAGRPVALYPLDPQTVSVERSGSRLVYVQRPASGGQTIMAPSEVLHVRTMGDGYVGQSPVSLFRETIGLGLAAEKAGAAFFGGGMRPGGVLEHPATLSDQAFSRLRAQVEAQAAGSGKQGRLLITEEGMKYQQLSIPPDDAQYIETRVHQVRDIARIFRLPPHKLADLADATFSNVEEQNREYVDDCLAPWLVQWEQEIAAKLLLPEEREAFFPRFEFEGLLRGNATTRAAFYSTMFHVGAMSINEIREKEDLNSIGPDGDQHLVPVQLQPAGTVPVAAPPQTPSDELAEVDAAHRAVIAEACARICRERERTGKRDDARHASMLLAPVASAACAAGAPTVDAAAVVRSMLSESDATAMVACAVLAICKGTK